MSTRSSGTDVSNLVRDSFMERRKLTVKDCPASSHRIKEHLQMAAWSQRVGYRLHSARAKIYPLSNFCVVSIVFWPKFFPQLFRFGILFPMLFCTYHGEKWSHPRIFRKTANPIFLLRDSRFWFPTRLHLGNVKISLQKWREEVSTSRARPKWSRLDEYEAVQFWLFDGFNWLENLIMAE